MYASCCGSVDFFAEALDAFQAERGGEWRYAHAAEKVPLRRRVLARAWGLREDQIFKDASDSALAQAACVDLYVASPDCTFFSKRRRNATLEDVVDGAMNVQAVLPFLMAGRAAVAVIENVTTPNGVDAISTVLRKRLSHLYSWREQTLGAEEHAGVPVSRERHFWVGIRHDAVFLSTRWDP